MSDKTYSVSTTQWWSSEAYLVGHLKLNAQPSGGRIFIYYYPHNPQHPASRLMPMFVFFLDSAQRKQRSSIHTSNLPAIRALWIDQYTFQRLSFPGLQSLRAEQTENQQLDHAMKDEQSAYACFNNKQLPSGGKHALFAQYSLCSLIINQVAFVRPAIYALRCSSIIW